MRHPLLTMLFATVAAAILAISSHLHGAVVDVVRFLAVFFALSFFLLIAFVQFWNRPWPLDAHPRWGGASPKRRRSWRRSTSLVKW